jgi:hypothetical protein
MIRSVSTVLVVIAALSATPGAQQKPDFSGVWLLDPTQSDDRVYGQLRVITQTSSHIEMAVLQLSSGPPRAESRGQIAIIPWELPFDRWRPRRGGEKSLEPVVQSRWDGNRLVTVKAPGTNYSVLWIWSLSDDGMTMTVDGVSTRISESFDFKVTSAPRGFIPDRHVYTRVSAPVERPFPLGDALIRFARDTTDVGVTCAADACAVIDVVNGRRTHSRTLARGREAMLSLHANTLISAARN